MSRRGAIPYVLGIIALAALAHAIFQLVTGPSMSR